MDNNTNFRISIPKPCHEDWNKFTPDEKGAFCKVCSKSVHDFTKKTAEEIKTVLVEEMSAGKKVCGRFNEDQLSPAETIPALDAYSLNFQRIKKFAMALFLVFGGFLFSSVKSSAQKMGKVRIPEYNYPIRGEISVSHPKKDSAATQKDTTTAVPKVSKCTNHMMKGDVMVEPIEKVAVMGGAVAIPIEEPTKVLGQAVIVRDTLVKDTAEVKILGDTIIAVETKVVETEQPMIMGMMVALPQKIKEPIITEPFPSDSIWQVVDGEFAVQESTFVETKEPEKIIAPEPNALKIECYPNPSRGFVSIKYSVKENVPVSIQLFDMNGNLAKTLLAPQNMYAADYQTQFDVSDLQNGIYLCELIAGNNKTTERIVIAK